MQGLPPPQVSLSRNVQEWIPLRKEIQLVQAALPDAGTGADVGPVQHQRRQLRVDGRWYPISWLETQLPSSSRYDLHSF